MSLQIRGMGQGLQADLGPLSSCWLPLYPHSHHPEGQDGGPCAWSLLPQEEVK